MAIKKLTDRELLAVTKELAQDERDLLTRILHHLREIERRRLYSDLGYASLFEYAVKELHYSEGQAGRRIQAVRLIREIPEVEKKIVSGQLNLTNISQAQSFFREVAKASSKKITSAEKIKVLEKLEGKSTRQGQSELLKLSPVAALPKERERQITDDQVEIRFLASKELKRKLEEVRTLAGPKGATMSFSELFEFMSEISANTLRAEKFGKKRAAAPAPELKKTLPIKSKNPAYISKGLSHLIFHRDKHRCRICGSSRNLNIDHIVPLAKGGTSTEKNLRLLCFNCNQRAAIKVFGLTKMETRYNASSKDTQHYSRALFP